MNIKEVLKPENDSMTGTGTFILSNVRIADASNGSKYVTGVVGDKSGSGDFKIWNRSEFSAGLYDVEYRVNVYNNRISLIVTKAEVSSEDPENYIKSGDYTMDQLVSFIREIKNSDLKMLVASIYKKYADKIRVSPAAVKHHQNYRGGLVDHLCGMFEAERGIIYPDNVDRDLVLAGIALHDIGKLMTYTFGESGEPAMTPWGNATDHVALSIAIMLENIPEDKRMDETMIKLGHVIAGSHTQRAWGAIVDASSAEAKIVGSLDMMNSAIYSNIS